MSNKLKLGELNGGDIGDKDASHVPHVTTCSDEELRPGDYISTGYNYRRVNKATREAATAIVDPFIQVNVIPAYTNFLALLMPGQVKDLVHSFAIKDDDPDDDDDDDGCNSRGC
jgi:hypothetical protein